MLEACLDLVNHKNVQSQLKLKSADNAIVKLRPPPPNVIMTLIFPQGLWTTPLKMRNEWCYTLSTQTDI